MPIAVLRFPGTNNERDIMRALSSIPGADPFLVPSREGAGALKEADGVIIPGGFSYGDYIRAGAVAAVGEIIEGVKAMAEAGRPVLGICNGFQILTECGLLPGALLPNTSSRFVCKWVYLRVSDRTTLFTEGLENAVLRLPIAHAEGNYYCSEEDLMMLQTESLVPIRYGDAEGRTIPEVNPNGSLLNIAAVINKEGNVMGMMPHPERASRASLGSTDGLAILENFVRGTKC
ncbi:MAG: phosphoribosylformylglycinamidine synthase I [Candidatus Thorarchaeota archaeon]|nr:phosphoribosylformylglycinamidine synthase I [Candidatus Thorarchaeota archaeon]